MGRLYTSLALGIFLITSPLAIKSSYAGITDFFKSDFDYCVDKVNAAEGDYTYAARSCAGASSGVKKCMKKIYATEGDWSYAARSCTGN